MSNELARLEQELRNQAAAMPCSCSPYRGGSTDARHFSSCQWDSWMDGFTAAALAIGVASLPDVPITAEEKTDDSPRSGS